jgi:hypothetical protein
MVQVYNKMSDYNDKGVMVCYVVGIHYTKLGEVYQYA